MHKVAYALGIDIGDGGVTAAVCRHGEQPPDPQVLPLEDAGALSPAATGRDGTPGHVVAHVMARVGTATPLVTDDGPGT